MRDAGPARAAHPHPLTIHAAVQLAAAASREASNSGIYLAHRFSSFIKALDQPMSLFRNQTLNIQT